MNFKVGSTYYLVPNRNDEFRYGPDPIYGKYIRSYESPGGTSYVFQHTISSLKWMFCWSKIAYNPFVKNDHTKVETHVYLYKLESFICTSDIPVRKIQKKLTLEVLHE